MSNKFYVYGGTSANVFCDIRCYDDIENIWKLVKQDSHASDFQARFGHCLGIFYNFLIIWGGCGPYLKKMKTRACYGEIVAFDLNTNQYVKLEGGPSQLQLEADNTMKLTDEQQMKNTLKQTF